MMGGELLEALRRLESYLALSMRWNVSWKGPNGDELYPDAAIRVLKAKDDEIADLRALIEKLGDRIVKLEAGADADDYDDVWKNIKEATAAAPLVEQLNDGPGWLRFQTPDGSVCAKCRNYGAIRTTTGDVPCECPCGDIAKFRIAGVNGEFTGKQIKNGETPPEAGRTFNTELRSIEQTGEVQNPSPVFVESRSSKR